MISDPQTPEDIAWMAFCSEHCHLIDIEGNGADIRKRYDVCVTYPSCECCREMWRTHGQPVDDDVGRFNC